jgi:hypothetical protein
VLHQMRQTQAKEGRGEFPPPAKSEGAMGRGRARPLPTAEATPWLKRRAMDRQQLLPDSPLFRTPPQPCRSRAGPKPAGPLRLYKQVA